MQKTDTKDRRGARKEQQIWHQKQKSGKNMKKIIGTGEQLTDLKNQTYQFLLCPLGQVVNLRVRTVESFKPGFESQL